VNIYIYAHARNWHRYVLISSTRFFSRTTIRKSRQTPTNKTTTRTPSGGDDCGHYGEFPAVNNPVRRQFFPVIRRGRNKYETKFRSNRLITLPSIPATRFRPAARTRKVRIARVRWYDCPVSRSRGYLVYVYRAPKRSAEDAIVLPWTRAESRERIFRSTKQKNSNGRKRNKNTGSGRIPIIANSASKPSAGTYAERDFTAITTAN